MSIGADEPFTWREMREPVNISQAQQVELLHRYQAGDDEALRPLLLDSLGNLHGIIAPYVPSLGMDDAFAAALEGFVRAARAWTPRTRVFASTLPQHVRDALHEVDESTHVAHVPGRTARRWRRAYRLAGGDLAKAEVIAASAPEHDRLTVESFREVTNAMRGPVSVGGGDAGELDLAEEPARADADVLSILLPTAWAALDADETRVVGMAYGYGDEDRMSDEAIARVTGWSRPRVQRVRTSGLAKMREALGVA